MSEILAFLNIKSIVVFKLHATGSALAMWRHSVFRLPLPLLIKDTKAHFYFDAQRYSSAGTEATQRKKIEHIFAQIANAMLAGGLLNYFIVGL